MAEFTLPVPSVEGREVFAGLTGALALKMAALGQPRGGRGGRQASVRVSPASARNNILEAREAFLQEGSFLTTKPLCFVRNLSNFPSSCARCCQPRGQHGLLQNQKREVGSSRGQPGCAGSAGEGPRHPLRPPGTCGAALPLPGLVTWALVFCPRAWSGKGARRSLLLRSPPLAAPAQQGNHPESWQQRGTPLCLADPMRRSPPGSAALSAALTCSGARRARVSRETAGHLRECFSLLEILDLGQI